MRFFKKIFLNNLFSVYIPILVSTPPLLTTPLHPLPRQGKTSHGESMKSGKSLCGPTNLPPPYLGRANQNSFFTNQFIEKEVNNKCHKPPRPSEFFSSCSQEDYSFQPAILGNKGPLTTQRFAL